MKRLRIVQIGDVHYPETATATLGDIKDKAFPSGVLTATAVNPLQTVVRKIQTIVQRKPAAILLCGDLTSYGDVNGYKAAVGYLVSALALNKFKSTQIHVVPGNHDVERPLVDPSGTTVLKKFKSFSDAWSAVDLSLTVESVRATSIGPTGARIRLYSLNSSIGCGEKRRLPAQIQAEFEKLLKNYAAKVGDKKAFDVIGETLDTPAFQQEDLGTISEDVQALDPRFLPVVMSHHNLLPQALLRVEMYTDLINSGAARSGFSRVERPLLYCHGHIHENPVEIIHDANSISSHLVCVSAPKLSSGFNLIEVVYGEKGFPLGCAIHLYELDQTDGQVRCIMPQVRFHRPSLDAIRRYGHHLLPAALASLPDGRVRFADVMDRMKGQSLSVSPTELGEILQEGKWLGYINIEDDDVEVDYWQIQRLTR